MPLKAGTEGLKGLPFCAKIAQTMCWRSAKATAAGRGVTVKSPEAGPYSSLSRKKRRGNMYIPSLCQRHWRSVTIQGWTSAQTIPWLSARRSPPLSGSASWMSMRGKRWVRARSMLFRRTEKVIDSIAMSKASHGSAKIGLRSSAMRKKSRSPAAARRKSSPYLS